MPETPQKRTYRIFNTQLHKLGDWFRKVSLPGFQKVPIYDVFWFFVKGIRKGSLNMRASSIAFNFMLALGPGVIFLIAVIPYMPMLNFKQELLQVLTEIMPGNSYIAIEPLLSEIFERRGSGLTLLVGLYLSVFFAQKGINGIIEAFNSTYHEIESRPWYKQRMIAVALVFIFYGLIIVASLLMFISKSMVESLAESGYMDWSYKFQTLYFGKWLIIISLAFCCISFLYYLAPLRKTNWRFFSAGSMLSTVLTVTTSIGFSYFMNNIAQLNRFLGSLGAIVALMLWFNFNALTLLIGFELNASINNANLSKLEQ